jgi:uncharacterized protein (TIGR02147 family)
MKLELDIYGYGDYRSFLQAYCDGRRKQRRGWSYGTWARVLGLRSSSTLVMIIRGQRHPEQTAYFTDLVNFEKTKNDARLSAHYLERLAKRRVAIRRHFLAPDVFESIATWHHYAIRELVCLADFVDSPEWMAERLGWRITAVQAAEARDRLLALGLLARTDDGRLVQCDAQVLTHPDVRAEGARFFHQQMLQQAQHALRATPTEKREVVGSTFAVSAANLPRAKELIRRFHDEMCDVLEVRNGDALYQLQLAFFPLTEEIRR